MVAAGDVVAARYELVSLLGEGGMGAVWAAIDRSTETTVALKLLKRGSRERALRFMREARALMELEHPAIVRIRDVGESDDPYIAMELLEGESLEERLDRGPPLTLDTIARIFLAVTSAVGAAHARGIVHRDLKPANIFLVRDARGNVDARVLDFGVAKLTQVDAPTEALTETGDVLGTPRYMSPEQLDGDRTVDRRTDIWSLGVVLYECLSGGHPIREESLHGIFKAIQRGAFPSLSSRADLSKPLTEQIDRMLCVHRARRPADLRDLHDVLRTLVDTREGASWSAPARMPMSEAPPRDATIDDSLERPKETSSLRAPMLLTVMIVLALAIGWWVSSIR